MKRVLITGASGFIGQHLLPFLQEKDYEVFPCYHSRKIDFPPCMHPVKANLLDQEERRALLKEVRPSHLIHLAWYVNPLDYMHSQENLEWMLASIDLFTEFGRNGGKRCLSVGSCAEYDWSESILEEEGLLQNETLYACAKNITHHSLEALGRFFKFDTLWPRIFWLYGPGESPKRFIPSLISTLDRGETFICKDPDKEIDLMHVKEVAYALCCALDDESVSGALNIASGHSIRIETIVKEIASLLHCPPGLVKFEHGDVSPIKIKVSSTKIKKLRGFHYHQKDALKDYVDSIRKDFIV